MCKQPRLPPPSVVVNMPDDIVFDILLRLPVVSLLRFKSVCKPWRSLIESSGFVSQHRLRQKEEEKDKFIILQPYKWYAHMPHPPTHFRFIDQGLYSVSLSFEGGGVVDKFERLDYPPLPDFDFEKLQLVGHCHGIICLHLHNNGAVYLWNPSTKQCRVLPEPPIPWQPLQKFDYRCLAIGFGFDESSNDYKVVRFWTPHPCKRTIDEIYIYSLNTDSWKVMKDVVLPDPFTEIIIGISALKAPLYNDGIFCWLASGQSPRLKVILYFDFKTEVVGKVELPDEIETYRLRRFPRLVITRGGEKITCIRVVDRETKEVTFEVWVMNEFGNKDSWTNTCNIGPFPYTMFKIAFALVHSFSFLKNGELLFLLPTGKPVVWTPLTNQVNSVLLPESNFRVSLIIYNDSLLSPHPPLMNEYKQ